MKPKILTTLHGYDRETCRADILAGVTVAMVAAPLSLAIAIASGAGPAQGLITAVVAGFLISLLGGSRVQIGGPHRSLHRRRLRRDRRTWIRRAGAGDVMAGVILLIAAISAPAVSCVWSRSR